MYVRTYVKHVNTQIYYVRKAYQCIKLRHITNGGNGCKWVDAGWKLVRVGGSGLKMSGSELKMSGSGCASEWQWMVAQFYITRFKFAITCYNFENNETDRNQTLFRNNF